MSFSDKRIIDCGGGSPAKKCKKEDKWFNIPNNIDLSKNRTTSKPEVMWLSNFSSKTSHGDLDVAMNTWIQRTAEWSYPQLCVSALLVLMEIRLLLKETKSPEDLLFYHERRYDVKDIPLPANGPCSGKKVLTMFSTSHTKLTHNWKGSRVPGFRAWKDQVLTLASIATDLFIERQIPKNLVSLLSWLDEHHDQVAHKRQMHLCANVLKLEMLEKRNKTVKEKHALDLWKKNTSSGALAVEYMKENGQQSTDEVVAEATDEDFSSVHTTKKPQPKCEILGNSDTGDVAGLIYMSSILEKKEIPMSNEVFAQCDVPLVVDDDDLEWIFAEQQVDEEEEQDIEAFINNNDFEEDNLTEEEVAKREKAALEYWKEVLSPKYTAGRTGNMPEETTQKIFEHTTTSTSDEEPKPENFIDMTDHSGLLPVEKSTWTRNKEKEELLWNQMEECLTDHEKESWSKLMLYPSSIEIDTLTSNQYWACVRQMQKVKLEQE